MFDCSVGVGKPYFVDIVQNVFARVFERNERCIGLLLFADKEDERFLADKTLVIVHPSHTVI